MRCFPQSPCDLSPYDLSVWLYSGSDQWVGFNQKAGVHVWRFFAEGALHVICVKCEPTEGPTGTLSAGLYAPHQAREVHAQPAHPALVCLRYT